MRFLKKLLLGEAKQKPASVPMEPTKKDDWATYKRYKNDDFWLIIVDRALQNNNQITSMSWYSIEYRFLKHQLINNMFPKPELSDLYYGFEDFLTASIAEIGGILAATETGFGSRMVYYCAPNLRLENILREAARSYEEFPVNVSPSSFEQYKNLLPTNLESQLQENDQIFQTLAENGDDGLEPRAVMHWAYGSDPELLMKLAEALESSGYLIEETRGDKLIFSRLSILSVEQARRETTKLIDICDSYECQYDGWETPVVKPSYH